MFKKFTSMILVLFLLFLACSPAFAVQTEDSSQIEQDTTLTTVYRYFDCLANRHWDTLTQLLAYEDREEFESFIRNTDNENEHIGYFNYASVELISCVELADELLNISDVSSNKVDNYTDWACWECSVYVTAYRETKYLSTGYNQFLIYTALDDEGNSLVIEVLRLSDSSDVNDSASVLSYDAPVPASGTGVWKHPSTINVKGYGNIDFLSYCYVVTANEFGTDSFNYEAKKAVALAVKQYGWNRTLVQKYPNYEYDVQATTNDQSYNPNKTPSTSVISAVDAIWDYVMLTCDLKLFCSFHVQNSSVNAHASYHGGMLSQEGANSLGKDSSYSWKEILHYYYDYGTYNSEMKQGVISIVNLNHTPSNHYYYISDDLWFHYSDCSICGCVHYGYHTWTYSNKLYTCSICGITSSFVPTIMNSLHEGDVVE